MAQIETFYDVMRRQGITRRSFMKYCTLTTSALGLGPAFVPRIAHAMETKPPTPVIWVHGLEYTCCSKSFIRSAHPLAKDVVLSMISLDYDGTLMAAAGHAAGAAPNPTAPPISVQRARLRWLPSKTRPCCPSPRRDRRSSAAGLAVEVDT